MTIETQITAEEEAEHYEGSPEQVTDEQESQDSQDQVVSESSDADELARLREHEQCIRAQAERVQEAQQVHEQKKREAKTAKDNLDGAYEELTRLCAERPSRGPLFDDSESSQSDDGDWRETDIGELVEHGAPSLAITKLRQHEPPIDTLGKLADHQGNDPEFKRVSGIGDAARENIESAQQAWFAQNQSKWQEEDDDGQHDSDAEASAASSAAYLHGHPPAERSVGGFAEHRPELFQILCAGCDAKKRARFFTDVSKRGEERMTIKTPILAWHCADGGTPQARHPVFDAVYYVEPRSAGTWQVVLDGEPVSELYADVQTAALHADWLAYGGVIECAAIEGPHQEAAKAVLNELVEMTGK